MPPVKNKKSKIDFLALIINRIYWFSFINIYSYLIEIYKKELSIKKQNIKLSDFSLLAFNKTSYYILRGKRFFYTT